jgi:UDP-N-acetylglucosamine diphosphorylase/glucosamine-1-phosphate N-acetyltransferase
MKVILFDPSHRHLLFPFTLTRPVADLRMGTGTLRETWERIMGIRPDVLTVPYLTVPHTSGASLSGRAATTDAPDGKSSLFINAALLPDTELWEVLRSCTLGEAFIHENNLLAFRVTAGQAQGITLAGLPSVAAALSAKTIDHPFQLLVYPWQLVQWNDMAIRKDMSLLVAGRTSAPLPPGNQVSGEAQIFLEEGARVSCSILNAATGPIYLGRNAEIMEGCLVRGPLVMGEGAVLKMGTRIYGASTIGPYSVAGGELKNVIIMGYSNKGHDGYLGDALIGEWCNLGAGASNSNVRNNATPVRVWNPGLGAAVSAGLKAGLLMGDYSRAAIQSAFNTGAVVGVCCNVFGGKVCSGYLPDFSWGTAERYEWDKVLRDVANWKKLKGHTLTGHEIQILRHIFGAQSNPSQ